MNGDLGVGEIQSFMLISHLEMFPGAELQTG